MSEILHPGTSSATPRYVYARSAAKGPRAARRPYDHHAVLELTPGTRADDETIAIDTNRRAVRRIVKAFYDCNRGASYPDGRCQGSRARAACLALCAELNRAQTLAASGALGGPEWRLDATAQRVEPAGVRLELTFSRPLVPGLADDAEAVAVRSPRGVGKTANPREQAYEHHAAILERHLGDRHFPTEAPSRLGRLLFRGVPEAEAVQRALAGEGGRAEAVAVPSPRGVGKTAAVPA